MEGITEHKQPETLLQTIAAGTASSIGADFFRSLTYHLAQALGVRYAFIAECPDTTKAHVRTLAFWRGNDFGENFSYPLAGSPCLEVLEGEAQYYPTEVCIRYPDDALLRQFGAESYLGLPLLGTTGAVLGHVAVFDDKPMAPESPFLPVLKVFAARAGAELERHHAEEALRESEARYRALYTQTPVMLHSVDANGKLLSVSDFWLENLGYERHEVLGRESAEFLTEAARQHAQTVCMPRFFETGVLEDEALQLIRKNGEVIDVLLSAIAERDAGGRLIRSMAVLIDVTPRKQAEDALRASEERYRMFVAHSSEGIWRMELDPPLPVDLSVEEQVDWILAHARHAESNDVFAQMYGFTFSGEALGSTLADLVPEFATQSRDVIRLFVESGYRLNHKEITEVTRTGAEKTFSFTVTGFVEEGHLLRAWGVQADITERKRAEAEVRLLNAELEQRVEERTAELGAANHSLQESERRFRELFESSPDAIFVEDREGNVLDVNPAACALHETTRDMLVGVNIEALVPERQRAGLQTGFTDLVAGKTNRIESYSLTASGQAVPVEIRATPIRYGGQPALLLHVRDITARKQAEERLWAKNEALKDFVYTVSHDLKAPLRGIAGYARELSQSHQEALDERGSFCIHQITKAARNLNALIDDLLQFSRLEAETPTSTEVEVPRMVKSILEAFNLLLKERGFAVTVDLPFSTISCWKRGLRQILSNLISNAVTYSRDEAQPRIAIRGEVYPKAYRIMVEDNGIGFDMKYHDRIFGLFNRLVRQEDFEGTGAGLAIAKKLAEKQGGTLWAEAEPGRGAIFFLELPRSPAAS